MGRNFFTHLPEALRDVFTYWGKVKLILRGEQERLLSTVEKDDKTQSIHHLCSPSIKYYQLGDSNPDDFAYFNILLLRNQGHLNVKVSCSCHVSYVGYFFVER